MWVINPISQFNWGKDHFFSVFSIQLMIPRFAAESKLNDNSFFSQIFDSLLTHCEAAWLGRSRFSKLTMIDDSQLLPIIGRQTIARPN